MALQKIFASPTPTVRNADSHHLQSKSLDSPDGLAEYPGPDKDLDDLVFRLRPRDAIEPVATITTPSGGLDEYNGSEQDLDDITLRLRPRDAAPTDIASSDGKFQMGKSLCDQEKDITKYFLYSKGKLFQLRTSPGLLGYYFRHKY